MRVLPEVDDVRRLHARHLATQHAGITAQGTHDVKEADRLEAGVRLEAGRGRDYEL